MESQTADQVGGRQEIDDCFRKYDSAIDFLSRVTVDNKPGWC